jgi:two-component system, NtrC family, nitrogen regulation sensor histidine kinase NtrY
VSHDCIISLSRCAGGGQARGLLLFNLNLKSEISNVKDPHPNPPQEYREWGQVVRQSPSRDRGTRMTLWHAHPDRPRRAAPARRRMKHETRILLYAALGPLPAVAVALVLLWTGAYSPKVQWTLTVFVLGVWAAAAAALHERVVFPLRTLSNMLAALREHDFSLRARGARPDDPLGEVMIEVNALGETLREQRLGAVEATALLRRVMAEIDVAVFAFDSARNVRLVNQRGERLLGAAAERLVGQPAESLGLAECLTGDAPRIVDAAFPGGSGRWELRRSTFLERGQPQQLLVLSDLTRTLREEERQAWQRLVQVLRHEVNNSLAPIHSLAQSLAAVLDRDPKAHDWEHDLREGLGIIAERSKSLNRFMSAYVRLTRLPKPTLQPVRVEQWVRRVVGLETRLPVAVDGGPEVTIRADPAQLDQLLINLVTNAVDAATETAGGVRIGWGTVTTDGGEAVEVWVDDEGPGVSNPANLFVPFYTTKPQGSGIGLVLSRQIAEAHGGSLALQSRASARGARATLRLPVR